MAAHWQKDGLRRVARHKDLEARMRSLEWFHRERVLPGLWLIARLTGRAFGRFAHPRQQPMALALERVRLPAAYRLGRCTAGRPEPLRPLHHTGYAHAETLGRSLPARNRRNNTLTQIERVSSCQPGWLLSES